MRTIVSAAALAIILSGAAVAQGTTSPGGAGTKMSSAECSSTWIQLGAKTGGLSKAQAQSRVSNFSAADSNNDGKLSQSEFMDACEQGLVTAEAGTGTGSRGITGSDTGSGSDTTTSPGASPGTSPGGTSPGGPPGTSPGTGSSGGSSTGGATGGSSSGGGSK